MLTTVRTARASLPPLGIFAPASGTSYARSACARPTSTTSPSQARRASWARSGSCNAAGNPPRTPRKAIAEGFRSDRVELFPLIPASVRSCATHASAEDRFLALPARSLGRSRRAAKGRVRSVKNSLIGEKIPLIRQVTNFASNPLICRPHFCRHRGRSRAEIAIFAVCRPPIDGAIRP
jgi:hypothetical protein